MNSPDDDCGESSQSHVCATCTTRCECTRVCVSVCSILWVHYLLFTWKKREWKCFRNDALRLAVLNVSIFNFPDKLNKTEHRIPANTAANIDSFFIGSCICLCVLFNIGSNCIESESILFQNWVSSIWTTLDFYFLWCRIESSFEHAISSSSLSLVVANETKKSVRNAYIDNSSYCPEHLRKMALLTRIECTHHATNAVSINRKRSKQCRRHRNCYFLLWELLHLKYVQYFVKICLCAFLLIQQMDKTQRPKQPFPNVSFRTAHEISWVASW